MVRLEEVRAEMGQIPMALWGGKAKRGMMCSFVIWQSSEGSYSPRVRRLQ